MNPCGTGAEAQGKHSSAELQLGQEIIPKLSQGVGIKPWNIDCICDSETLGAVCVIGFEKQWIRLSSARNGLSAARNGTEQMMDLSCRFVISKADLGKTVSL